MSDVVRRKKASVPPAQETTPPTPEPMPPPPVPPRDPVTSKPFDAPLVFDFAPRKVSYAGDLGETWFVSAVHEGGVIAMDRHGEITGRFAIRFIDRAIEVGGTVIGLDWEHAWGRRWGYSRLGEREHASAYDLNSGERLWHFEGGMSALSGDFGVAREKRHVDSPQHVFELLTGKRLWSFDGYESVVVFDEQCLYILRRDGTICAYETRTGRTVWKYDPAADRRVRGNLCRALALFDDGIWYVSHPRDEHAVITRLSRRTGQLVDECEFDGWISNIFGTPDGLFVHHEFGLDALSSDRAIRRIVDDVSSEVAQSDGRGAAVFSTDDRELVWTDAFQAPVRRLTLNESWDLLRVQGSVGTLCGATRFLRWPLVFSPAEAKAICANTIAPSWEQAAPLEPAMVAFAGPSLVLVEHETRGRFTLKVPNTGLSKGDSVSIGGFLAGPTNTTIVTKLEYRSEGRTIPVTIGGETVAAGPVEIGRVPRTKGKKPVPAPVRELVQALVDGGLIDAMSGQDVRKIAMRVFPEGSVGDDSTARLLQHLYGTTNGLSRGFLSHDSRFGQETDDVVAEFAECLKGEPITIRQIGVKPTALHVRTSIGSKINEDWVDLESGGLESLVEFINAKLTQAGAVRRIASLETNGDWHAYVIRTPEELRTLRKAGVPGLSGEGS